MSDRLETYLHDHLGGSVTAIDLLEQLRDNHAPNLPQNFAEPLLAEIIADRDMLRGIAERVGASHHPLKDASGWLMEKATRLKLGSGGDLFSTFEALEFLTLGILGKEALWRALKSAAPSESRLRGYNFNSLAVRAHTQYEKVEQQRLAFAGVVFKQGSFR